MPTHNAPKLHIHIPTYRQKRTANMLDQGLANFSLQGLKVSILQPLLQILSSTILAQKQSWTMCK